MAVVEVEGETWVLWEPPNDFARARALGSNERRTLSAGPISGFVQADLDADGAIDLLVAGPEVHVYWSFGTTAEADSVVWSGSRMARDLGLADVDADGDTDLVIAFSVREQGNPEAFRLSWIANDGARGFGAEVPIAGDATVFGPAFDLSVHDVDGDGDADAYVCNDVGREVAANALFLGDGAGGLAPSDGTGALAGLGVATSCMGVTWGDANGDGALDLHVAAASEQLLLLADAGGYYDAALALGLDAVVTPQMAWGAALGDLDNDGQADLVVSSSDFYGPAMAGSPLWWYHRTEAGAFEEVGEARGLPQFGTFRGVVARDLNADGVPDVVVGDALRSPSIWLSEGCTAGGWLEVEAPSGSLVRVEAGGGEWVALATSDAGWASSGPARAHFGFGDGLGEDGTVDRVTIHTTGGEGVSLSEAFLARRVITWTP